MRRQTRRQDWMTEDRQTDSCERLDDRQRQFDHYLDVGRDELQPLVGYTLTHPQNIIAKNNTAKGQYISTHYMEQHITMCAFISAMEVNALQESRRRLLGASANHLQFCSGSLTRDTNNSTASWSRATYRGNPLPFNQQMLI